MVNQKRTLCMFLAISGALLVNNKTSIIQIDAKQGIMSYEKTVNYVKIFSFLALL